MQLGGNLFTHYNYSTIDIEAKFDESISIQSKKGKLRITANPNVSELPQHTVFANEKDALRFVGPMPYTFTYDDKHNRVITVKGVRQKWTPKLVRIEEAQLPFFKENNLSQAILSSAFITEKINYKWEKGEIEQL